MIATDRNMPESAIYYNCLIKLLYSPICITVVATFLRILQKLEKKKKCRYLHGGVALIIVIIIFSLSSFMQEKKMHTGGTDSSDS